MTAFTAQRCPVQIVQLQRDGRMHLQDAISPFIQALGPMCESPLELTQMTALALLTFQLHSSNLPLCLHRRILVPFWRLGLLLDCNRLTAFGPSIGDRQAISGTAAQNDIYSSRLASVPPPRIKVRIELSKSWLISEEVQRRSMLVHLLRRMSWCTLVDKRLLQMPRGPKQR